MNAEAKRDYRDAAVVAEWEGRDENENNLTGLLAWLDEPAT